MPGHPRLLSKLELLREKYDKLEKQHLVLLLALKGLLQEVDVHELDVEDMHAPIPESYLAPARGAITAYEDA